MTAPTDRNRLDEEESPYLRQHADNPVNWQPWDETAREAAREQDVPIFLSVGYAACHWCHVMEDESFEDEGVARLLNEQFVPIKVDREERPDVDRVYQTICQQVTGRGGWPLSVWLTPDGRPFYVGTYFPKEPKRGMPGFRSLLTDIQQSWTDHEERDEIESRADEWQQAIEGELSDVPDQPGEAPDEDLLDAAATAALRGADRDHGGWGRGQKFPHPGRIHVLGRATERDGATGFREVLTETLDAMADGGLYDHLGGGFHRYTTDREWVVPHFEKMLYDNAEIPRAMLAGYQLTGTDRYATVARETFEFLQRELQHPDGGFYSTLDAQSDGEEGKFYVWTPSAVEDAIEDETDAALFEERFGVTDRGNFEGGQTVLTISQSIETLATANDMAETEVEERLDRATSEALDARGARTRPPRDEKVLAGWNGLTISALAAGATVLDDRYASVAADALSFVREHHWDEDAAELQRRFADGVTKIDGYLEDYAFLGKGAFDLYQATGEVDHLAFARSLAAAIEDRFWDAEDGTLYFTPADGEELVARPQELTDQSTPSSTGVACQLLAAVAHFVPHDRFEGIVETVLETHANDIEANPLQHASLTLAADTYHTGALELTLVAADTPAAWQQILAETYLPASILAWRPPSEAALSEWLERLSLTESPPIWADREARNGGPTVYACRSFTCSPPKESLAGALKWATAEDEATDE